jgi:hypothetical protein
MECWNPGMVESWVEGTISIQFLQLPITPSLHYSIIPIVSEANELDCEKFVRILVNIFPIFIQFS